MKNHQQQLVLALALSAMMGSTCAQPAAPVAAVKPVITIPGMPPVIDPTNLYSEAAAGKFSPAVKGALSRVYVPNHTSGDVYVIDPETQKVVDRFKVGVHPQHIVPSWDMKTLWVGNNAEGRTDGSLTPIDPWTGKPGKKIVLDDPYNVYFTPDGKAAIIVAEARKRLDFRNPHTMALEESISTEKCGGINHADFSMDGKYAIFTCEFDGSVVKIDVLKRKVLGYLKLAKKEFVPTALPSPDGRPAEICTTKSGMPQDIRISPDGKVWYIADMMADGVFMIDGDSFTQIGFIPTGIGAHGLYPSRDGKKLYVANRGGRKIRGTKLGKGSVAVIDFATRKVETIWPIPGGGSPDMGNVSADGKYLWLAGRYDNVVYMIDTTNGKVKNIPVGKEPHGLTVWPQPGRYSLGHTGNIR